VAHGVRWQGLLLLFLTWNDTGSKRNFVVICRFGAVFGMGVQMVILSMDATVYSCVDSASHPTSCRYYFVCDCTKQSCSEGFADWRGCHVCHFGRRLVHSGHLALLCVSSGQLEFFPRGWVSIHTWNPLFLLLPSLCSFIRPSALPLKSGEQRYHA
jgi:hypothetical protein